MGIAIRRGDAKAASAKFERIERIVLGVARIEFDS